MNDRALKGMGAIISKQAETYNTDLSRAARCGSAMTGDPLQAGIAVSPDDKVPACLGKVPAVGTA